MTAHTIAEVLQRATEAFAEQFDERPSAAARAPGRVNLIGDHTDYSQGFVLPMAIDRHTIIVGKPNYSKRCRVVALDAGGEMATFLNNAQLERSRMPWVNYVKGVVAQFNINGHKVPSFDAVITSSLPQGAGLGGGGALLAATATFIEALLMIRLAPFRKAQWCHQAEVDFVQARRGIMDTMISCAAVRRSALFIDCRSGQFEPVEMPNDEVSIVVANTGVEPDVDGSGLAQRVDEVGQALAIVRQRMPHVQTLRDATLTMVEQMREALGPTLLHRARHVILENQRVLMVADALNRRAVETAGFLMYESHRSLRDEFAVSCPELDAIVELTQDFDGAYGARMTSMGFGGCAIALVGNEAVPGLIEHMEKGFAARFGRPAECFRVVPAAAAKPLPITPAHPTG
ncbi:MAG: galactokinase [Planctomycetes bacterium]|nr:galactokinase [Planctomycetota bacterium]